MGEWGCLEDDWALSETAGAQEEMQRTGEDWVMRDKGLHEGWMRGE